jgi:hypothetical protein
MGPEPREETILTGWKEIADYLKCSVRSCLRWEAKAGLPVRRPQEAQGSRVIAYKSDLDAWLKARIGNGTIKPGRGKLRIFGGRAVFTWLPLLLMVATVGIWLGVRKPSSTSAKETSTGTPESAGPFDILPGDIVESEWAPAGLLRIWRDVGRPFLIESWRIEPVRHTSLAIGDLDGDPDLEVVAPGHCREERTIVGRSFQIRFFLNAYKVDYRDWWKTTYFDPGQCVWEEADYSFTEVAVGNIDGRPGREIVLVTAHSLSSFRYDPSDGKIRMIATRTSFLEGSQAYFRSVTLSDIDGDGTDEILATANEGQEGEEVENRGWLFIVGQEGEDLAVKQAIPTGAVTFPHALRVGDVIPGGLKEAVFPLLRKESGLWLESVGIWRFLDRSLMEVPLDESGSTRKKRVVLDVGDLVSINQSDEIIVGRHDPNELVIYSWDGAKVAAGPRYALDHRVRLNGVDIFGGNGSRPRQGGILAYGGSDSDDLSGRTYIELIEFDDGYASRWRRLGGEKGDLPITYAAVGQSPR